MSKADLVLWVSDVTRPETRATDPALAARLPSGVAQLHVINKIDLLEAEHRSHSPASNGEVWLSALTGAGRESLQIAVLEAIGWTNNGEGVYMARARHLQALRTAARNLESAATHADELELLAEELKFAQQTLASITGEFSSDDLLGKIFTNFCIGK